MFESVIFRPANFPADIPSLTSIEISAYPPDNQWNAYDFRLVHDTPDTRLMVCDTVRREYSGKVQALVTYTNTIGFMAYSWYSKNKCIRYQIENIAIYPEFRRQGIASQFINHLIDLAKEVTTAPDTPYNRYKLCAIVCEENLTAQLFMRANRFLASANIAYNYYGAKGLNAYRFAFDPQQQGSGYARQEGHTQAKS